MSRQKKRNRQTTEDIPVQSWVMIMDKDRLFELYRDDFVRELVSEYLEGEINSLDEVEEIVREYFIENGYDLDDVQIFLGKEIERQHIFER